MSIGGSVRNQNSLGPIPLWYDNGTSVDPWLGTAGANGVYFDVDFINLPHNIFIFLEGWATGMTYAVENIRHLEGAPSATGLTKSAKTCMLKSADSCMSLLRSTYLNDFVSIKDKLRVSDLPIVIKGVDIVKMKMNSLLEKETMGEVLGRELPRILPMMCEAVPGGKMLANQLGQKMAEAEKTKEGEIPTDGGDIMAIRDLLDYINYGSK